MGVGMRKEYRKRQYLKKWSAFYLTSFGRDISEKDEEGKIKFLETELNKQIVIVKASRKIKSQESPKIQS